MPDATTECTPYYYAPVGQAVAAGKFPPVWTPATIIANDNNALAKYQSIQSQIPNIPPNGYQPASLEGNWTNFTYPASDPDCWWTYGQCTTPKLAGLPPDLAAVPEVRLSLRLSHPAHPPCSRILWVTVLTTVQTALTMPFTTFSSKTTRKPVRPLCLFVRFARPSLSQPCFTLAATSSTGPSRHSVASQTVTKFASASLFFFARPSSAHPLSRHLVSPLQSVLPLFPRPQLTLFAVTALTNEEVFAEFYYSKSRPTRPTRRSSLC